MHFAYKNAHWVINEDSRKRAGASTYGECYPLGRDVSKERATSTLGDEPENGDSTFLRNVHKFRPDYTVSDPRRHYSSQKRLLTWNPVLMDRSRWFWGRVGRGTHAPRKGNQGKMFAGSPSCNQGSCVWRNLWKMSPVRNREVKVLPVELLLSDSVYTCQSHDRSVLPCASRTARKVDT